jgi:O-antigen/teichoic acid export membrane protein
MSPLASEIDAREEPGRLQQLLLDSATFSMMVVLPIAVTFLLRGESFIGLWMGPAYAPLAGRVLFVLTLPLLFHAGAYGTGGLLLGIGRHKPLAPLMVVEGLCNLALSIILVRRFGIVGVAWGTAIPNLISSVLFWPWFARRTFGIEPTRYVFTIWVRPAVAILPFAILSYCIERFWRASNLFEFIIQVAACVPFALAGFWPICVSADQRGRLRTIVRTKLASAFV